MNVASSILQLTYPFNAMKVKFTKMLRSKAFAHQLSVLYRTPPIETEKSTKSRDYISKWLMTVLSHEGSRTATIVEFPIITKKIRDEVLGKTEKSYFRRSYTYMGIKALLQHNLTIQIGRESGKFLYKILMLKFLIKICDFDNFLSEGCPESEMIAKMGRRIEKLHHLIGDRATNSNFMELYQATVEEAKVVIDQIRAKIDKQIKTTIATEIKLPPLTGLNFGECINQKMPKLTEYMRKRTEDLATQPKSQSNAQISSYHRFFVNINTKTSAIDVEKNELGERIFWLEFENMILYDMEMDDQRWSVDKLRTWSFAYAAFAESKYKDNQLFSSRMILVRLKILSMLDRCATKKHQLLLEHRSGIDPNIIDSLLLPQRIDMKIAYDLEQYFGQRNGNAPQTNPSLIGERDASKHSFSTKYAQQNDGMKAVHRSVLEADNDNVEKQRKEWLEGRQRAERLRDDAKNSKCINQHCEYDGFAISDWICEKCRLNRRAEGIKIAKYEHLLPDNISMQYAIVFELHIPEEILCLRDTLYEFTKYGNNQHDSVDIKFKWNTNRLEISNHNQSTSARVWLGSGTKFEPEAQYVNISFDYFHVKNTSDCIFYGNDDEKDKSGEPKKILLVSFKNDVIKKACTFQTKDEYEGLQWTLDGTNHSQNEVLGLPLRVSARSVIVRTHQFRFA